jgi:hypothetical protein
VVTASAGGGQARATVAQLTSAASLSPGGATLAYSGTVGNTYGSPLSFSAESNTLTFSAAGDTLELDQVGVNYGVTAFSNGTYILFAGGFQGATAPITISFASPVTEFGVNAEDFKGGPYTVSFTVFDGPLALATFTTNGNDPKALSFEGAVATGGDAITSIVISDDVSNNIGLGPISFATESAPMTGVPEPASVALFGFGLAALAVFRRRTIDRSRGSDGAVGTRPTAT